MLRGAFGHALRALACMTREPACPACPLSLTCPYSLIFETPAPSEHKLQKFSAVPNPYIIEPPDWGRRVYNPGATLVFSMVLIGHALEKLALVVYAWQRAFARQVGGGTAELAHVFHVAPHSETLVYDAAEKRVVTHDMAILLPAHEGNAFCLRFMTPLRLQENGKALPPEALTARVLLMALARRVSLLAEFHTDGAPGYDFQAMSRLADFVACEQTLRWRHWERYSNRQQKTMTLNGLVGEVRLRAVPPAFHALLVLGRWTHVGKNATFGLGGYTLEDSLP